MILVYTSIHRQHAHSRSSLPFFFADNTSLLYKVIWAENVQFITNAQYVSYTKTQFSSILPLKSLRISTSYTIPKKKKEKSKTRIVRLLHLLKEMTQFLTRCILHTRAINSQALHCRQSITDPPIHSSKSALFQFK